MQTRPPLKDRVIRAPELAALIGCNKVTLWRMQQRGQLPKPSVRITAGIVGWWESEIHTWIAQRTAIAQRDRTMAPEAK